MRRRIAAAAASVAMIGAPAAHGAMSTTDPVSYKPYETRYLELRQHYVRKFGLQEAGRDIVSDGYREKGGQVRLPTKAEVLASVNQMDASLHPPAVTTESVATSTSATYSAAPATSSSTVECESGGDYSADTGNGYYGAYQFDQSTWDAYAPSGYAGVNPASAPPAVQDAAAASVPYDAWPSC